jgi:hypothetical protein
VAGANVLLRITRPQEMASTTATGRQRGDGNRPSGNSSNSRHKNRKLDGHNIPPAQPAIRAAGSDPGVTMVPRMK